MNRNQEDRLTEVFERTITSPFCQRKIQEALKSNDVDIFVHYVVKSLNAGNFQLYDELEEEIIYGI